MTISPAGGRPKEAACVKQNGQCSKCMPFSTGATGTKARSGLPFALCELLPWAVQTSFAVEKPFLAEAASAWEIEGASDAIRIAKQAIQAVKRCLYRLKPMSGNFLGLPANVR